MTRTRLQDELPPTTHTNLGDSQLSAKLLSAQRWQLGQVIDDYELLAKIGEGALGVVYLAKQVSLNRPVAMKVTDAARAGASEGLALAGLDHEHIVKVHASFVDDETNKHCLILQYVPGTNLAMVITKVHATQPRSGQDILNAIDAIATRTGSFDPRALQDRELLGQMDFFSAVCRIGEQLCSALSFAHNHEILHCDIKPGNILLTHYGQPMLVDFNISVKLVGPGATASVGGTPKYMSPEQEAAFRHDSGVGIDHRTDLYSLGVVLVELATGKRPDAENEHRLAELPVELRSILKKCLAKNPNDRYATADELATSLAGVRAILTTRSQLPHPGWLGRCANRYPISVMLVLALIPHLIATVLNIAYNKVQIELNEEQHRVFTRMIVTYNPLIYTVCLAIAGVILWRFHQRRLRALRGELPTELGDATRREAVHLTRCGILFSLLGWAPGAILFPLVIHLFSSNPGASAYLHFLISFLLSGLVGMVYSYFGILYVILRSLYPQLVNPEGFSFVRVESEIRQGTKYLGSFLVLATLIPLTGAVLLICLADTAMTLGFRLLVTSLIILGMLGITVLLRVTDHLSLLMMPWISPSDETNRRSVSWSAVFRKHT